MFHVPSIRAALGFALLLLGCGGEGPSASNNAPVAQVSVTPEAVTLAVNGSASLQVAMYAANGARVTGRAVTWSSSDPSIATVTSTGVVTGVSLGTATITATSEGQSGTSSVSVVTQTPASGPIVSIDPSTTYQTMTGWEGTAQTGIPECAGASAPAVQDQILTALVNDLGINRVRLEVRSGIENPIDWEARYLAGQISKDEWRNRRRYEIINDNADPNVLNPAGFQWSGFDDKVETVVLPLKQRLAARGEKLYINLNYVDFGSSAFEHRDYPAEYGEFMFAVFQHLQQKYGWVPDAVEIILEPDNSAWNGTQIGQAIVAAGDRLAAAGYHPAFIAPSSANMQNAITAFDQLIGVPRVRQYLTDLAYHRYGGVSDANLRAIVQRAQQYGLRAEMLEHIASNADDLHDDLTTGRNSAWQQYALAYCVPKDDGSAYYQIDLSNAAAPKIVISRTAKFLRQYFKFIRAGAVRVAASSQDGAFDPVAFRNANGKFVVVVKASRGGPFQVAGLPAGTYGVKYTTDSQYDRDLLDASITSGKNVGANIPDAGVITIYAR